MSTQQANQNLRSNVVVVGAGFYGLIAAKTYLQVTGCYTNTNTDTKQSAEKKSEEEENDVLIIDSDNDIGGTWAHDRLYPNLLTQNSYGYYEFSDLPLTEAVPDDTTGSEKVEWENGFIPGWKLNQYLHVWARKWDLMRRIRLQWKVTRVSRLQTGEWVLDVVKYSDGAATNLTLTCNKLILATGLTSTPKMPDVSYTGDRPSPAIHAKDVGQYCRENFGYQPIPQPKNYLQPPSPCLSFPKSVVVYGGAKSAFDLVHLFGSLHRKREAFHIEAEPAQPVQVHWIIKNEGTGPAWMASPTLKMGTKDVPSDQAGYMRMTGVLDRFVYQLPKRMAWSCAIPRLEGSWLRRLLHENRLGRAMMRHVWKGVDAEIRAFAKYDAQPKMAKLLPKSVNDCTGSGGIANHTDLFETIHAPNVHIHRSTIVNIESTSSSTVNLEDNTQIPSVDLVIHATGWEQSMSLPFDPPELAAELGLPHPSWTKADTEWREIYGKMESRMRNIFDPALFAHANPPSPQSYRLFRRQLSSSLIEKGDRSFAVMGASALGAVAIAAEVQALWVAAFLTGNLDGPESPLNDSESIRESIARDVVWGRSTNTKLALNVLQSNDTLLRDLGLNPNRKGGGWWKEMTEVYGPTAYAGIVDEWIASRETNETP